MSKGIHRIKVNGNLLFVMKDALLKEGIETYISDGGLHLHIRDNQLETAQRIAEERGLTVEEGILPAAEKAIQQGLAHLMKIYARQPE